MKTLSVILCQCIGWQSVINAIPWLCWGVIGLVALFLLFKFVILPSMNHHHEIQVKQMAFEQERFWHFQKELKTDFKKELEERIENLKKEKGDLSALLKKEKNDREKMLSEERLKVEHDFYKKIIDTFYSAEKQQPEK